MSLLKQPYEIKTDNLKPGMIISGQPGVGKSTLALSMPNPVMIDADNGVHRVDQRHRVPTLQVTSYQEVLDLIASDEIKPFETIVVDTVGRLLDFINVHIVKENPKLGQSDGQLAIKGWGVRAQVFRALLNTVKTMGKYLVFVAHITEDKDGDSKIIRPDFGGGKAGYDLIKDVDVVGYMEMLGRERTISFAPSERYYAKNSAKLDDVLKIPVLKDGVPNDFMTKIMSRFKDAADQEVVRLNEYTVLMEQIKTTIDGIADVETANAVVAEMDKLPEVWDSKIKARAMFKAQIDMLKLTYDKENKTFVAPVAA